MFPFALPLGDSVLPTPSPTPTVAVVPIPPPVTTPTPGRSGDVAADGSKVYDPAKKDSSCKAVACAKTTSEDIAACCIAPAKCSTIKNTKLLKENSP